jgi:hypothetical protein
MPFEEMIHRCATILDDMARLSCDARGNGHARTETILDRLV